MLNSIRVSVFMFFTLFLSSCATNETIGSTTGAIVGGIIGSQLGGGNQEIGAAVGALIGFIAGKAIGSYLDDRDQKLISEALDNNINGQKASWTSSKKGTGMVEITPISTSNNCRKSRFSVETTDGTKHFERMLCKGSGTWAKV